MIIGVGGGTGSGKSAIVRGLVARIGGCVIDLQSYAHERTGPTAHDRNQAGEDEPSDIDTDLLIAQLADIRRGAAIRKPVFSRAARMRTGIETVAPARLVLVEGLFTLWWASLRSVLDLKVFVDAPSDLRLRRRLRRDLPDGGRAVAHALHRYAATHERYVEPTRAHADDVVVNDGPLEDAVQQVITLVRRRGVDGPLAAHS